MNILDDCFLLNPTEYYIDKYQETLQNLQPTEINKFNSFTYDIDIVVYSWILEKSSYYEDQYNLAFRAFVVLSWISAADKVYEVLK